MRVVPRLLKARRTPLRDELVAAVHATRSACEGSPWWRATRQARLNTEEQQLMATTAFPTRDDFAAMLNESLGGENETFEGKVVKGTVTGIENDMAVIDVGLKSEGRVALREFAAPGQKAELKVGDEVEVYVDRVENSHGEAMLSRDRARREAAWDKLEGEFSAGNRVEGVIFGRVKGGFPVDLGGAVAFLPGSQVDIRPVRDVGPLMDLPQ